MRRILSLALALTCALSLLAGCAASAQVTELTADPIAVAYDGPPELAETAREAVAGFQEPVPGARERVARCLHVILTAYLAARLKREAETLLSRLA